MARCATPRFPPRCSACFAIARTMCSWRTSAGKVGSTPTCAAAQAWLDNPAGDWKDGLKAAEKLANLLEAGQLIAMREPPTRTIGLLRQGQPNPAALREQISNYIALLRPLERPGGPATPGVALATMPDVLAKPEVYPIVRRANSRTPVDCSTIRGANYSYAESGGSLECGATIRRRSPSAIWTTRRRLGINQIRCFISYPAYRSNPDQFRQNLLHLVRAADQRGIGVMPVVGYSFADARRRLSRSGGMGEVSGGHIGKRTGPRVLGCGQRTGLAAHGDQLHQPQLAFAKHMAASSANSTAIRP